MQTCLHVILCRCRTLQSRQALRAKWRRTTGQDGALGSHHIPLNQFGPKAPLRSSGILLFQFGMAGLQIRAQRTCLRASVGQFQCPTTFSTRLVLFFWLLESKRRVFKSMFYWRTSDRYDFLHYGPVLILNCFLVGGCLVFQHLLRPRSTGPAECVEIAVHKPLSGCNGGF